VEGIYDVRLHYPNDHCKSLVIDKSAGLKEKDIFMVQVEMLIGNRLPGHLNFTIEEFNLEIKFYYDVRGYKSLKNYLRAIQHEWGVLQELYLRIISIVLDSNKYLLDANKYILKLPLIYVDPNKNEPYLIYLPLKKVAKGTSIANEYKQLFINIFQHKEGVELNYYNSIIDYFDASDFTLDGLFEKVIGTRFDEFIEPTNVVEAHKEGFRESRLRWLSSLFVKNSKKTEVKKQNFIQKSEAYDKTMIETGVLFRYVPLLYLEKRQGGQAKRIDLDKQSFIIGRNKNVANYYEESKEISRVHLEIMRDKSGYLIKDLDSKNGSFLNGSPLEANKLYPINEGDLIKLASTEYTVRSVQRNGGDGY
jgi:hypothetical protein